MSGVGRRRTLDTELVRRGLATDREQARTFVGQGMVTVGGAPAQKVTRLVGAGEAVVVASPPARFVSRGGLKLDAALDRFGIDPSGLRAIDAGSSTGGFTDCLLQRGAREVVAIDVGRNQLHERIRSDPRVDVNERTNIKGVDVESLGGPADILVADLSFISLRTVAEALVALTSGGGSMVLLVKPQFEASRAEADRAEGIITNPTVWSESLQRVCLSLRSAGGAIMGVMVSPITGGEGNVEFLVHVQVGTDKDDDPSQMCDAAVAEARGV